MSSEIKRLIVGISGASGAQIGTALLRVLKDIPDWETHLVISGGGERTIEIETSDTVESVSALADKFYRSDDIGATIASGTFRTAGMVVAPCSMKTLAGISGGYSENLLLRAADVTIKEGRTLVLIVRESPLSAIHLKNMLELARIGVVIMPAMVSYYNEPAGVEDMTRHIAAKTLDRFGIDMEGFKRWEG
jgi:polyprenyl P-hydroxybenzoate/phenylacrylic acid decarboxylase-like protein